MEHIALYLGKINSRIGAGAAFKTTVADLITSVIGSGISQGDIKVSDQGIFITASPIAKAAIVIHKRAIQLAIKNFFKDFNGQIV